MYHIIMQTILYNNFYGSVADTNTHMRVWDCAYAENVDGRSEPECLKLNREVSVLCQTWSWLPIDMIDWYILCDDWTIRLYNSWVVQYTAPWPIVAWSMFWSYVLIFYEESWSIKIANIPLSWTTRQFWSAVADRWRQIGIDWLLQPTPFIADTWSNISFINHSEDILYFSIWRNVYILDYQFTSIAVATPIKKALTFESEVVWLTRDTNSISIYLQNGRKYFWWGIGYETPDGYSDLWISRVTHVWTAKNVDYVLWVWASSISNVLFLCQWQSTQRLREAWSIRDGISSIYKFNVWTNCRNDSWMWYNHNLVFFPLEDNVWIMSLWTQNEIVPYWFINEYVDRLNIYEDIWTMSRAKDANNFPSLYIWVRNNSNNQWYLLLFQYDRNNTSYKYQPQWARYTKKEINQAPQQNRIKKYYFRYDLPAWTNIDIYYALNWSSTYTLLTSLPSGQLDHYFDQSMFWNRHEIQHKIVLRSTNNLETPRLYSMAITTEETRRGISSQ